ncbi:hypothetical protein K2X33_09575 [bacterium]|nr:hypothetical protein [bacterium]
MSLFSGTSLLIAIAATPAPPAATTPPAAQPIPKPSPQAVFNMFSSAANPTPAPQPAPPRIPSPPMVVAIPPRPSANATIPTPAPARITPYVHKPFVVEAIRARPTLFYTRGESAVRTSPIFRPAGIKIAIKNKDDRLVTEQVITLETMKREAEIDVIKAQHEHEADEKLAKTTGELHAQMAALVGTNAVSRFEFENSRARLIRTQWKAVESGHKIQELQAEIDIDTLKLDKARGQTVMPSKLAGAYAQLWRSRHERAKALEQMGAAEYYFLKFVYDVNVNLKGQTYASETELLRAQRDAEESEVIWKLAKALVVKTEESSKEADKTASAAAALENQDPSTVLN